MTDAFATGAWRQARLEPKQLPRLAEALDGLLKLLVDGGAQPKALLGASSGQKWLDKLESVDKLVASGWLTHDDLLRSLRELPSEASELEAAELIDKWLLPTLLRGVAGFTPLSPDLDLRWRQAQAATWAVDAWRPLFDPTLFDDGPAVGSPEWLPLLPAMRAATGHEGLAPLVDYALGRGPQPPFVADWLRDGATAVAVPAAGEDDFAEHEAAWLEDLLLGLHARRRKQRGWPVLVAASPAGGVIWDLATSTIQPAGKPETLLQAAAEGWLAPLPSALPAPPAASALLRDAGWQRLTIQVEEPEALDDVLDALFELCDAPQPPFDMEGEGFRVTPR